MYTSREMPWGACAAAALIATLATGCGKDEKGPGSSATGGSGEEPTGGSGGRSTGGTSGSSTGGAGGTIGTGGSGTGGGAAPAADAGASADTGSASDASGAAVGPERFVGEWDYANGGAQLSCPGQPAITQTYDPTNYITIKAGAGVSPLILALMGCNLRFDIQGQAAVIQPGQSCALAIAGKPATRKPDVYTFALAGDGLRESSRWTVTFTGTADAPCTLTTQGTLTRHP
jgi:hypothetical protein